MDELQEKIQEDEDHVQSTDVAAMQSKAAYPASQLVLTRARTLNIQCKFLTVNEVVRNCIRSSTDRHSLNN